MWVPDTQQNKKKTVQDSGQTGAAAGKWLVGRKEKVPEKNTLVEGSRFGGSLILVFPFKIRLPLLLNACQSWILFYS